MAQPEGNPFSAEVVKAIMRHMNDDHTEDSVLIVRALGEQPGASGAVMTGMDADAIEFAAVVGGAEVPVRIPWRERLTERAQVRAEVVRMYERSRAALGLEHRPDGV